LEDTDQDISTIETTIFLTRGKKGALVFRYDNASTSSFLFGSRIRTGISNSAYAKLEPIQHALFNWEVTERIAPRALVMAEAASQATVMEYGQQARQDTSSGLPAIEQSADLPGILVDVRQHAISHLPTGASITYFVPEKSSGEVRWISMKGEANSNREVSDLLRAMMQHAALENVELVSLQATERSKIEFDIRLKLKERD
ncbi:MAG: PilN domain-containing protein, partial [Arenimonas sp.]